MPHHWATQLPAWFWILTGFVLGYWAAYVIASVAQMLPSAATHVTIRQHGGIDMITGIVNGGSGKFQATFNGALQPGSVPSWSVSDPSVVIAPSADGLTCDAAVPGGAPIEAFTIAVAGLSSNGTSVATSATVPVLAPPPIPATSVVIDQIA